MFSIKVCFQFVFFFTLNQTFANINNIVRLNITIDSKYTNNSLIFYKPFSNCSNNDFPELFKLKSDSVFSSEFIINKTTFFHFSINDSPIWLILEPGDSLNIKIKPELEKEYSSEWLELDGKNKTGNLYFSCFYNYQPGDKYTRFREKFENYLKLDGDLLIKQMFVYIDESTEWVNDMYEKGQISLEFKNLMTTEIRFSLAKEMCIGIRKFFIENNSECDALINKVIKKFNPFDITLQRTLRAKGFCSNYLENIKNTSVVEPQIEIGPVKHNDLAPKNWHSYLWANSISVYYRFEQSNYDFRKILNDYKSLFGENEQYLALSKLISIPNNSNFNKEIIINENYSDLDFFQLISSYYRGQNLYIDLWATWCKPCLKEFINYDDNFYELLKEYNIKLLFISIDDIKNNDIWKLDILKKNLRGYHIRANNKLFESIKDIIYDNKEFIIPRYLIINKNGKIINSNASKPSSPQLLVEFKNILDK